MPNRRAHLIGIAGSGMSALARLLVERGWQVSGSDAKFAATHPIARQSVDPAAKLADADLVIFSDAIPPDHIERQAAAQRGIEAISYPQMLGRLMSEHQAEGGLGLAVAGTHGKSTTTAMAAAILQAAKLPTTAIFGAQTIEPSDESPDSATNRRTAGKQQPSFLAEACEYRENFRHLRPNAAVILNVEPDHFDYYANAAEVEQAFSKFADQVVTGGELVVSANCPMALRIGRRQESETAGMRLTSFAIEESADWQAKNLKHSAGKFAFELWHQQAFLGDIQMSVLGRHNVANALAAAALAASAGATASSICSGIASFSGLKRRLQRAGEIHGIAWIDDFAHHPTEITAALAAVRQMFPRGRVWCIFEPHQVSRTAALLDEFASSLQNTDTVLVTDIFRAREGLPRPGEVGPADLTARIRQRGANSPSVHSSADIEKLLAKAIADQSLGRNDVLVTLGAGNVERIAHGLIQRFRECRAAG